MPQESHAVPRWLPGLLSAMSFAALLWFLLFQVKTKDLTLMLYTHTGVAAALWLVFKRVWPTLKPHRHVIIGCLIGIAVLALIRIADDLLSGQPDFLALLPQIVVFIAVFVICSAVGCLAGCLFRVAWRRLKAPPTKQKLNSS